jgi:DNA-binding XRE family transcriptional regulator
MSTLPKKTSNQIIEEFAKQPDVVEYYQLEKMRLYIATRLKQIREAKKLSQTQIADLMGVKQSYVAGLESGKRHPTLNTLNKFCIAVGGKLEIIY